MQDGIAMAVDRVRGADFPPVPRADTDKAARLFISPANYAGQGFRWGRAVERDDRVDAKNLVYAEINPFGYPADYSIPWRTVTHDRVWQRRLLDALAHDFTHVLIEAEFPPLGGMWNGDVRRQVRELRARGVVVGALSHGNDIRLPSRHREHETWSPFVNDDWVPVDRLEKVVAGNRALLDDLACPTFVSTPGLMLDVPYAKLLPVVIDPRPWRSDAPVLERVRPRVLHIPSNPLVKGTAEIEPVLRRMHDEGVIEYVTVTGLTQAEMPAMFASGDIVLDQFRLGDYGVAACEAMAAGRLVISHIGDYARDAVRAGTGIELPIVEADLTSLEAVLRDVLAHRSRYRTIANAGPEFVDRVHDGEASRAVLEEGLLRLDAGPSSDAA
ncbi:hypothetical protein MUN77_02650 [Leucobacter allii]|uniref:hypothetical protein n=1 Tax=Leucobacter allii TaxID=2932247 RepID=UPI001FD09BF1|nr:hypothetical protein [Leucobacter allii]UOR02251.1 hypothetical protein MUN77_02650 [Leucobacter allii]